MDDKAYGNKELISAVKALEEERGIDSDLLFSALEEALVSACKRELDARTANVEAEIDRETGEISLRMMKTVVEEIEDPGSEIQLDEARSFTGDDSIMPGDYVGFSVGHEQLGRLAAQTAKSIINQRLQQAEKQRIQDEFEGRTGEMITGIIQSNDRRETIVDIGRAEAVLLRREQSRLDRYEFGDRMKFLISGVSERRGRPVVYVSRSQPGLVEQLFIQEVPELASGPIEIKSVVREAGSRTKIAVYSHDPGIDAVGSCVGQRGSRVQAVINELNGEKIDIIEWSEDPATYIQNALSPAKVIRVNISQTAENTCRVIVADNHLSLAIGKEGQNARLAARLTKWKIDIKSESQYTEMLEKGLMARLEREALQYAAEHPEEKAGDSAVTDAAAGKTTDSKGEMLNESDDLKEQEQTDAEIDISSVEAEAKNQNTELEAAESNEAVRIEDDNLSEEATVEEASVEEPSTEAISTEETSTEETLTEETLTEESEDTETSNDHLVD